MSVKIILVLNGVARQFALVSKGAGDGVARHFQLCNFQDVRKVRNTAVRHTLFPALGNQYLLAFSGCCFLVEHCCAKAPKLVQVQHSVLANSYLSAVRRTILGKLDLLVGLACVRLSLRLFALKLKNSWNKAL